MALWKEGFTENQSCGPGTWKDFESDEGGGVLDLVQREARRPDQARTGDRWRRNVGQVEGLRFETTDHGGGWQSEGGAARLLSAASCTQHRKKDFEGVGGVFSKGVGGAPSPPHPFALIGIRTYPVQY